MDLYDHPRVSLKWCDRSFCNWFDLFCPWEPNSGTKSGPEEDDGDVDFDGKEAVSEKNFTYLYSSELLFFKIIVVAKFGSTPYYNELITYSTKGHENEL